MPLCVATHLRQELDPNPPLSTLGTRVQHDIVRHQVRPDAFYFHSRQDIKCLAPVPLLGTVGYGRVEAACRWLHHTDSAEECGGTHGGTETALVKTWGKEACRTQHTDGF